MAQALASPGLEVVGIHAHIGSMIFELEPYRLTIETLLDFAAEMQQRHGLVLREFSPGGGWGIAYTAEDQPPAQADVVQMVTTWVKEGAAQRKLPWPRLILEPGRSIVGPAGVALYTVGSSKDIPGVRKYVAVDGGMSDNIRPAIYGSRYDGRGGQPHERPARGDRHHRRQVLRIRRRPHPRHRAAQAGARRPAGAARGRGLLPLHGLQLQPRPRVGRGAGQGRARPG